jgi:hypoxanthine phosphoribosyltransferase
MVTQRGDKIERITPLFSTEALQERIAELGAQISADLGDREVVAVAVLKGSILFFADLIRHLDIPSLECDFLGLSSYGEGRTESSGVVRVTSDLTRPIEGKHILVVEDIIDTGLTMQYLLENLRTRRPASVTVCSLLHKPARSKVQVPMDYVGFTIEDRFVVGYGLDYDERYRQLPWIGEMSFEDA